MEVAKCSPDLTVQSSVRDPEVTGEAGGYVEPLIDSADPPAPGCLLFPLSLPVFYCLQEGNRWFSGIRTLA